MDSYFTNWTEEEFFFLKPPPSRVKITKYFNKHSVAVNASQWLSDPGTGTRIFCQWNLDSGLQPLMGLRILWTVFCILQDSKYHQQKFPSFRNPFYEARKVKHILLQGNSFCFTTTWRGWRSTTSRPATLSWVSDTIVYFTSATCTRECTWHTCQCTWHTCQCH